MSAPKIIIHIGAGKAGSSSLQSFFSQNPMLKTKSGLDFEYFTLHKNDIHRGDLITQNAHKSVFGYDSSIAIPSHNSPDFFRQQLAEIASIVKDQNSVALVSNEGYVNYPAYFETNNIFKDLGVDFELIYCIRPPLDWLNSAYWQWGAWTNANKIKYFTNNFNKVAWYSIYESWANFVEPKNIRVLLATRDVVQEVLSSYEIEYDGKISRSNLGVSPDVVRFFMRNREFREGPHDPQVEFLLARYIDFQNSTLPWVIGPAIREQLFEYLGDQYRNFERILPAPLWEEMKNDDRWWSQTSYAGRAEKTKDTSTDLESADRLIGELIWGLMTDFYERND